MMNRKQVLALVVILAMAAVGAMLVRTMQGGHTASVPARHGSAVKTSRPAARPEPRDPAAAVTAPAGTPADPLEGASRRGAAGGATRAAKADAHQRVVRLRDSPPPDADAGAHGAMRTVGPGTPEAEQQPTDLAGILARVREKGDRSVAIAQIRRWSVAAPERLEELVRQVAVSEPETQVLLAEGLAAVGTVEAMQALRRMVLAAPPGDHRADLVEVVAGVTNPASAPYLLDILSGGGDEEWMQAAQRALGNVLDRNTFGALVARYAKSTRAAERDNLAGAVRHLSDPQAVSYLAEMAAVPGLDFEEPLVRAMVDTLGVLGTPEAVEALLGLIQYAPDVQRMPLMDAMERITNPAAMDVLIAAVKREDGLAVDTRLAALGALTRFDPERVNPVLKQLLDSDEEALRSAAADILAGNFKWR